MDTYNLMTAAAKGDNSAKEQLLTENSGLIYMVVGRFSSRGLEKDDLYQLAACGFLKAIDQFRPELGLQFSTYAVPMMMGEIRRFLRDNGPIKVSRSYKTLAYQAAVIHDKLMLQNGKEPSVSEIASALSVEPAELSAALSATRAPESLEKPQGESELSLKNLVPSPGYEDKLLTKISLAEQINALPQRERTIILLRYYKEETQSQVAKRLGISQVQVSRIEKKILEKLRKAL
ncbi:MAG: sigma-70 family RNA polymerase sigma factor [Clostridia bacterium]|nr:sigma-70 family RNA polymerase sigma factor [Clostridia bacterium]